MKASVMEMDRFLNSAHSKTVIIFSLLKNSKINSSCE